MYYVIGIPEIVNNVNYLNRNKELITKDEENNYYIIKIMFETYYVNAYLLINTIKL